MRPGTGTDVYRPCYRTATEALLVTELPCYCTAAKLRWVKQTKKKVSKYLAWTTSLLTLSRIGGTADAEIKFFPPPPPPRPPEKLCRSGHSNTCSPFAWNSTFLIDIHHLGFVFSLILFQDKVSCHKQSIKTFCWELINCGSPKFDHRG